MQPKLQYYHYCRPRSRYVCLIFAMVECHSPHLTARFRTDLHHLRNGFDHYFIIDQVFSRMKQRNRHLVSSFAAQKCPSIAWERNLGIGFPEHRQIGLCQAQIHSSQSLLIAPLSLLQQPWHLGPEPPSPPPYDPDQPENLHPLLSPPRSSLLRQYFPGAYVTAFVASS